MSTTEWHQGGGGNVHRDLLDVDHRRDTTVDYVAPHSPRQERDQRIQLEDAKLVRQLSTEPPGWTTNNNEEHERPRRSARRCRRRLPDGWL